MFWGALQRIPHKLSCLLALVVLLSLNVDVRAQCVADATGLSTVPGNRSISGRSALRGTLDFSTTAAWQLACRKGNAAQPAEGHRLATSFGSRLSMATAGDAMAHDTRIEMEPHAEMPSAIEAQMTSPIASRFDVRWQASPGPAWVQNVPDWVTSNARNYRHRGLPLVHLWESPRYLVALGLSNHGVPGLYFSQRLP
jgi:hypothetical protein